MVLAAIKAARLKYGRTIVTGNSAFAPVMVSELRPIMGCAGAHQVRSYSFFRNSPTQAWMRTYILFSNGARPPVMLLVFR